MSLPVHPQPVQPDEINIMDTAVKLARFLRRHLLWVFLFPILGVSAGYLNNLAQGPAYGGVMMIRSRILAVEEMTFLVQNYERGNYPGLSSDDSRHFRSLQFEATKEEPYVFGILSCESDDVDAFKRLAAALKESIENEPSVHAKITNSNDLTSALINQYTATIQKAELLLEQRDIDPTLAYKNFRNFPDLTLIYEKRLELEIARRDSTAVTIVSDFQPKKLALKGAKVILIGLAVGILLTVVMLFVLYFMEYYRKATS